MPLAVLKHPRNMRMRVFSRTNRYTTTITDCTGVEPVVSFMQEVTALFRHRNK